jgi:hypothetical protein
MRFQSLISPAGSRAAAPARPRPTTEAATHDASAAAFGPLIRPRLAQLTAPVDAADRRGASTIAPTMAPAMAIDTRLFQRTSPPSAPEASQGIAVQRVNKKKKRTVSSTKQLIVAKRAPNRRKTAVRAKIARKSKFTGNLKAQKTPPRLTAAQKKALAKLLVASGKNVNVGKVTVSRGKSARQEEKRQRLAAQFTAPDTAIGHYFKGTEHLQGLYGSRSSLHKAIRQKLDQDLLSTTALSGIPGDISAYAARQAKVNDFLDAATETVTHPTDATRTLVRPKFSAGRIIPTDGAGAKVGASDPHGGIDTTRDDRGHLVPEKGVSDTQGVRVNSPDNVIPENWPINQKYKTAFEHGVKTYARDNPARHVATIHIPYYKSKKGDEASFRARPKAVTHYVAVDGTIRSAFTFKNSKKILESRPQ